MRRLQYIEQSFAKPLLNLRLQNRTLDQRVLRRRRWRCQVKFLDTVVANVDGPKREDSASLEGNLIVSEPGVVSSPYMVIELSGHIVKTPETVARVDIRIGSVQRSVNWSSDEIKSGRFSIALDAPMQAGALPGYFPVSVVALVWRDGKQGTAMVSLEKVRVRLGKVALVAQK
jgi:hypothetical protein